MLLINGQRITESNTREFGRIQSPMYFQMENRLLGNVLFNSMASIPNGYGTDGILPSLKEGAMSSYAGVNGASAVSLSMQNGIALGASISGTGQVSSASLALIVSFLATISGTGNLSSAMQGIVNMAATAAGSGDITAALGVIAWCAAEVEGSSGMGTSTLRGTQSMAAVIASTGEILTADACARAVWADPDGVAVSYLLGSRVTRSGDIISIYDENNTLWRRYDLANGGRVIV
jgi:hypothetical protein